MICAAMIATETDKKSSDMPEIKDNDVLMLEKLIDDMEKDLPSLDSFILPGGNDMVSFCHIARTICRKAERKVAELSFEFSIPEIITKYLNRLSDFLFVLARKLSADFNLDEIPWSSKL
jgi:cob(I)alamin adenosyltransferase